MSMKINLSSQDISQAEIDAVVEVMKSSHLSLGPKLPEFEEAFCEYIGRKHAIAVNSGTSGMYILAESFGWGPGDEVITTPFSFVATTNIIMMTGATPVFVDIDLETYNITPEAIESKITDRTKGIVPVEVFGNPKYLDDIWDMAKSKGILCLEDSCEALGSEINGKRVGTLGDASTFAFYPNKQITTGEGGMILTDNDEVADMCRSLRNQGRDTGAGWLQHARLGYNYRLSDINCAVGIEQLKRVDGFIDKRAKVAGAYQELLADEERLIVPAAPENSRMSWFVFVVRLADNFSREQRDQVLDILRGEGIGCSNYFTPIHMQPYIQQALGTKAGDFPVTEQVSDRTIALPFHNNLPATDAEYVCCKLRTALDKL